MTIEDALEQIDPYVYPMGTTSSKCALEAAACIESIHLGNDSEIIYGRLLHALIGFAHKLGYRGVVLVRKWENAVEASPLVEPLCSEILYGNYREGALRVARNLFAYWFSDKNPKELITMSEAARPFYRFEEFKHLKKGWIEGHGETLNPERLDRLAEMFETYYCPTTLKFPYTYPTEEGGVRAEWTFHSYLEVSLDINLETFQAYWHQFNIKDDSDASEIFNLNEGKDWSELIKRLKTVGAELPI